MTLNLAMTLAQAESGGGFSTIVFLALLVSSFAGMWKAFSKAGMPGFCAIIPFVNIYCMIKIAQKPGWWFALLFIPLVNILVMFSVMMSVARVFGKGVGFGLGLFVLGFAFWPILGFGSAKHESEEFGPTPETPSTSFTGIPPMPTAHAVGPSGAGDSSDSEAA